MVSSSYNKFDMKIAVIDDDNIFAKSVSMQANSIGQIHVDAYDSGRKFVDLFKDGRMCEYDIALVDIMLPNMTGFAVHKFLKKICPDLRVFLVSGTIYKREYFDNYQSIIQKDEFKLSSIIQESFNISRFMNHLEIDMYEQDTKVEYA